jgi:purine-binding chemotaxis protein CheW
LAELDNDVTADVLDVIPEEEIRICLFSIGEDLYAIPVEMLTEIIILQKIFPVPTTPPHVLGVINLRGNIVPIVDIRPALALPFQGTPGQIAIIKHGSLNLGIVVDNVYEVAAVPESSVLAVPSDAGTQVGKSRSRFLKGAIQRKAGVAALLDIMQIFEEIKLL